MRFFRPPGSEIFAGSPSDLLAVGQLIDDVMKPGHFFIAPELRLTWIAARSETIPWEILHGRLLDVSQTRITRTFLSWHMIQADGPHTPIEPIISVKLDVHTRQIHVTRGLLCYVWQAHDAGSGVIESRENILWTRELVGTISLNDFADIGCMRDELICLIWQAIVGTSRLPLTSVEAPLPAFVFGQIYFLEQSTSSESAEPVAEWEDWLERGLRPGLAWREYVKLVEVVLRRIGKSELPRCAEIVRARGAPLGLELPRLLRALFNDVSLSPWTRFVENALEWVEHLTQQGALTIEEKIDFFSYLLRQLTRHLTAYDLVTFHHRGANYPDALLLDAVLKAYVRAIDAQPACFTGGDAPARMRRRGLRQACLVRQYYQGHLVPDLPTSPGENARVLPATHPRVRDEQILQPLRRRRKLFAGDPLPGLLSEPARHVLAQSMRDLEHADERAELGIGVFIDRPLGYAKHAFEPDLTPLLAHEAFSASIARRRWLELLDLCTELEVPVQRADLQHLFDNGPWPAGLPHTEVAECPRPVAALADVRKVAGDFVIVHTLPGGLTELMQLIDWEPLLERYRLRFLADGHVYLCIPVSDGANPPLLALYDMQLRRRLELLVDASQGYVTRAGVEMPRAGLRAVAVWEDRDEDAVVARLDVGISLRCKQ